MASWADLPLADSLRDWAGKNEGARGMGEKVEVVGLDIFSIVFFFFLYRYFNILYSFSFYIIL